MISLTSSKISVPPPVSALGEFEQLVLLALMRLGDNAYGVPVYEELRRRARRDVSLGAVYKTLDRLEQKGFVTSYIGAPTSERGGRRKRYFRIAPAGVRVLRQALRAIRSMTDGLAAELDPLEES